MKESLGWYYKCHKRIAIFMTFIMVFTMLPMNAQQVYAKSNEAKILIWSTYILQKEIKKLYAPGLKDFISKDEVAGYAGVDSISVDLQEGTQENPQHFSGTEDLSQYDLIIVLLPYEALTDTDVSVLKNYLNAGGRVVLQGERDGFARYENNVLSDFAKQLGVTVQITENDDDTGNAIINKDSDIMGGKDLVGNELEYRAIGELTYSGDAQVIATTVAQKYPFIVDFPVQKGRITVMSDINWWHRRSNMLHTPAQLQSAQELWGKILSNSAKNMEDVKNGINPNHEHHYNYISQGNKILAYCDETHGASECEYYGISNAISVTLLADDAIYSGEAYSGMTLEGIDTYNAITKSNLDKSQVSFYQVETKGTTSGGIKLESAPKEKGHYYAAITSNGAQAVAAFSIGGLSYSITIQNGTTDIADSKATEDTIVTIKADPAPAGKVFDKWVVESGSITLADANSATTTFTMPASAVSVKATYTDASHTHDSSSGSSSSGSSSSGSSSSGSSSSGSSSSGSSSSGSSSSGSSSSGSSSSGSSGVRTYTITASAGANGSWEPNSDGSLSIRGSGDFAKFQNVKFDGNLVDRNNYTVTEGSTIITLKADYLNTLSAGAHTFEMIWTDGSARTVFTIASNSTNNGGNNIAANSTNNGGNNITTIITTTIAKITIAITAAVRTIVHYRVTKT